jgi:hypothetical protein
LPDLEREKHREKASLFHWIIKKLKSQYST